MNIGVHLQEYSQVSGTYKLHLYNTSTPVNSGGTTLAEQSTSGYFIANIVETLVTSKAYRAVVTKDDVVIYSGWLRTGVSTTVDYPDNLYQNKLEAR